MKPVIERIEPSFGSSFRIQKFMQQFQYKEPIWHFHPEFEIVYVSNGSGKRHIGNHISYYHGGDLIMLGPNLPHFGFTQDQRKGHFEIVVQMKEEFLGEQFLLRPEMQHIKQLFERSRTGVSFYGPTKVSAGKKLQRIHDSEPFDRLIGLLDLLGEMAESTYVEQLNTNGFTLNVMVEDEARMQSIYRHVQNNFMRPITLDEMGRIVNMTVPAFCRYFKNLTHITFTQFVNEFRVAQACKLLAETDMLIADVAHESGFNNLSHFNKHFLRITKQTPSHYRQQAQKVLHFSDATV